MFADSVGGSAFISYLSEDHIGSVEQLIDPALAAGLATRGRRVGGSAYGRVGGFMGGGLIHE
jgi:hypothetical protein